jgi:hypothetical protein
MIPSVSKSFQILRRLIWRQQKKLSKLLASLGSFYNLRKLNIRACPAFIPDELEFIRRIQVVK